LLRGFISQEARRGALTEYLFGTPTKQSGERTAFPREVAEAALAHLVGDQTDRAYRRGDALEKRRALMDAWTVPLRQRKAYSPPPLVYCERRCLKLAQDQTNAAEAMPT
jgi:hypothetical protein